MKYLLVKISKKIIHVKDIFSKIYIQYTCVYQNQTMQQWKWTTIIDMRLRIYIIFISKGWVSYLHNDLFPDRLLWSAQTSSSSCGRATTALSHLKIFERFFKHRSAMPKPPYYYISLFHSLYTQVSLLIHFALSKYIPSSTIATLYFRMMRSVYTWIYCNKSALVVNIWWGLLLGLLNSITQQLAAVSFDVSHEVKRIDKILRQI